MKPLSSPELYGTWATVLLPLNTNERIDFTRLGEEIEILAASGVQGIYTNGTAGEFYAQSEAEFDRIHALLAERCEKARMPFQIGVSHTSAQTSLARLKRALQWKPSALQFILPDWYPLSDDEILMFVEGMAEAAGSIGLVLYNPPHAKRALTPAAYGKIAARIPSLIGLKVAGGDKAWHDAMRTEAPALSIFVPGHQLAAGCQLGAAGSYSNVACLTPAGARRWFELMQTDLPAALGLEQRIQRFFHDCLPADYSNAAKDKLLAAIGAWADIGTRLRWPYRWVPEEEAHRLRPVARQRLPELFETALQ